MNFDDLTRLPSRDRAREGARAGARLGLYFAIVGPLATAIAHRATPGLPLQPVTLGVALFTGFVLSGVLWGLSSPYVRDSYSAALVGAVCMTPVLTGFTFGITDGGKLSWRGAFWVGALAFVWGSALGALFWSGRTRKADD